MAREILIASLGLLLLPNNININIDDLIGKKKYLPTTAGVLEGNTESTMNKLNSVSETISQMARSYDEAAGDVIKRDEEFLREAKKSFQEELLNNLEDFTENMLYEDIITNDENITSDLYDILEQEREINSEKLIEVLNKNNNYIIGIDSQDLKIKAKTEKDIEQIVKAVNATYRINKLNLMWKQKEASNKKVLANQLGGVSKVISSIAEDITEGKEKQENIDAIYNLEIAKATITKDKSEVSGDRFALAKLDDGKFMLAISDGIVSRRKSG